MEQTYRGVHIRGCNDCYHCTSRQVYKVIEDQWVEIMIVNHEKLSPQEELVNDLFSKQIGGIVEKYSVAIKKKTEYMFYSVVYYLQEVSR